jgi:hypothetical protein
MVRLSENVLIGNSSKDLQGLLSGLNRDTITTPNLNTSSKTGSTDSDSDWAIHGRVPNHLGDGKFVTVSSVGFAQLDGVL